MYNKKLRRNDKPMIFTDAYISFSIDAKGKISLLMMHLHETKLNEKRRQNSSICWKERRRVAAGVMESVDFNRES